MKLPHKKKIENAAFKLNVDFYLNFPRMLELDAGFLPPFDQNGESAEYTFLCLENGIHIPTNDLNRLKRIQEGKMSVNLQIKMWAETLIDSLLFPPELKIYTQNMPNWVYEATIKQAHRLIKQKIGFVPTFLKV